MSCCFSSPRDKYEFGYELSQDKNKKNKKNKQKKTSARNGTPKIENDDKKNALQSNGTKTEEKVANDNSVVNNAEVNNGEEEALISENTPQDDDQTSAEKASGAHATNSQTAGPEHADTTTEEKRNSALSNTAEDNNNTESNTEENTENNTKQSEDKSNNNVTKRQVFVISRDKTNSFYGAAFTKKEEERKKEEEIKRKEEQKKTREEQMKKKLAALKAANAPKIEVQDVSEKMDENSTLEEPAPDYSDDEADGGKEEDYVELRKTVKNRISAMLTRDEWDQILDKADLEELEANDVEIPEPDYDGASQTRPLGRSHTFNVGGLHPDSSKRMGPENKARQDLHREMMMNKKFGVDVLHRKSELQREFSKRKEKEKLKDKELPRRSSLEVKLQEMATKMQRNEEGNRETPETVAEEESQPEFLRVYSKIYKTKPTS